MGYRTFLLKDLDYHRLDVGPALKGETADDYLVRCFKKAGEELNGGWTNIVTTLLKDRGFEAMTESRYRTIRAEIMGALP